ncbi:MAG: hypothetical protein AB1611_02395 [bacterium]
MDSPLITPQMVFPGPAGGIHPRVMRIADILDRGMSIYRQAPGLIWPLTLLGSLPFVLLFTAFYYSFAVLKFSPLSGMGLFQSVSCWSLWLTVLFFWRTLILGAQTITIDRALNGQPVLIRTSLFGALKKGLSLSALAAVWGSFFILSSFLLFTPYLLLGGAFLPALPLTACEGISPLHALKSVRNRVPGFFRRCLGIHLSILLLFGLMAANILIGLYFVLNSLHSLFNFDVSYWQIFFSPSNRVYLLLVLGISFLLTEPLRAGCGWLLYHDYKVRAEGHDLRQMADCLIKGGS